MTAQDSLRDAASALVEAAHAFHRGAETGGSHLDAPESLESLQEALQALSTAWYRVAADAGPDVADRNRQRGTEAGALPHGDGLSREQEVRLMGALHDVAAAFARCARACREGRSAVTPLISRSMHAERDRTGQPDGEVSWSPSSRPANEQHVAMPRFGEAVLR